MTPDEMKALVQRFYDEGWNNGDLSVYEELVAEGDRIACRWTSTGTQTGELFGIPPTGNQLHVTATLIYRVEDGKLKEGWINRDDLGLMRQLGAIPTGATA